MQLQGITDEQLDEQATEWVRAFVTAESAEQILTESAEILVSVMVDADRMNDAGLTPAADILKAAVAQVERVQNVIRQEYGL